MVLRVLERWEEALINSSDLGHDIFLKNQQCYQDSAVDFPTCSPSTRLKVYIQKLLRFIFYSLEMVSVPKQAQVRFPGKASSQHMLVSECACAESVSKWGTGASRRDGASRARDQGPGA